MKFFTHISLSAFLIVALCIVGCGPGGPTAADELPDPGQDPNAGMDVEDVGTVESE